jgi:hypothetical protein
LTNRQLLGATLTSVYWTTSPEENYSRYFITTDEGDCFEVTVGGLKACQLPEHASRSLEAEFREVLRKAKIADVRTDDQTDLAILLDTGHLIVRCGTFDGENTGNNFYLQDPAESAEWSDDFHKLRQVLEILE